MAFATQLRVSLTYPHNRVSIAWSTGCLITHHHPILYGTKSDSGIGALLQNCLPFGKEVLFCSQARIPLAFLLGSILTPVLSNLQT